VFGIAFNISRMPAELKKYWLHGAGAAKIRWGTGGDFDRCRRAIQAEITKDGRKPLPDYEINGLCANLHREATGATPGNAPGEHHHAIEDPTTLMAGLIAELAQRRVRDSAYWGLPVGTPIQPGMKPKSRKRAGYRPARHRGIDGWDNPPTTPPRPDDAHVLANIIRQQGWTGPMTVLDDDEFDAFAAESPAVVYRGVRPKDGERAETLSREFVENDDPYIGTGEYGFGWYTSDSLGRANDYTRHDPRPGKLDNTDRSNVGGAVVEMAFHQQARFLEPTKNGEGRDDFGEYAAQLGYDAVKLSGTTPGETYYLLVNRSAVVVRRMRQ